MASKKFSAERDLVRHWKGLSKKKPLSSFSRKALQRGADVEMEHVHYKPLARRIAADHLVEHKDYYRRLDKAGLAKGERTVSVDLTEAELKAIAKTLGITIHGVYEDADESLQKEHRQGKIDARELHDAMADLEREAAPFYTALAKVRRHIR